MSSPNFAAKWTCKYRKPKTPLEAQDLYNHIRTVAYLLDASSEWFIPTFPILRSLPEGMHFGLDSIIGAVIPVGGDVICLVIGLYQVLLSALFGISWGAIGWMLLYILADAFIGIIPIIGDFLDIAFKANIWNLRILEKELKRSKWAPIVLIPQTTEWIPRPRRAAQTSAGSFWSNLFGSRK